MSVVGIIAEFNPLHNGHIELLNYAKKELRASHSVIIMTGDFMQRGEPAMINKYDRAKLALKHGADLIIEMPVVAATSSAADFATCGISMLAATRVVDCLLFGSEGAKMETFRTAANLASSDSMDYHKKINEFVKQGDSYAVARQKAIELQQKGATIPEGFLAQPNNILGVEYIRALSRGAYGIEPYCLPRTTSKHNSRDITAGGASSSAIRNAASTNQEQSAAPTVPEDVMKLLRFNAQFKTLIRSSDLSLLLHNKLISENKFNDYLDCSEDLSNKIIKMRDRFVEFENFSSLLKSKDLTQSRIRRVLIHIILGIMDDDLYNLKINNYAPYLRILGFSSRGTALLAQVKQHTRIPFFISPQDGMPVLNKSQEGLLRKDVYASDIFRTLLTNKSGRQFQTEYTRKFELKDIE